MKKIVIASILATAAIAASAVEVSVSGVRDYNLDKDGYRVGATVAGLSVSATRIEDSYNRYAVGKDFAIAKVGTVGISAGGAVVYQDTVSGSDGYGLTAGVKASVPLAKNVDLVAGVERFAGQERVNRFNGTVGTVGLNVKF